MGWRVVAIARQIREMGTLFDLNLQLDHPDHCGGLRPIGDLCLVIALVLSPLILLVGGWLALISVIDPIYIMIGPIDYRAIVTTLQILVIPLALLSLIGFFEPLGGIHTAMQRAQLKLQGELDSISQEINQLSTKLLRQANELAMVDGESTEKRIGFLQRVYERSSKIPIWPVRVNHILGLSFAQIPAVVGLGASMLELFRNVLAIR